MNTELCIFCEEYINLRKKSKQVVYENQYFVVVADILPLTSFHLLIISKRHAKAAVELTNAEIRSLHQLIVMINDSYCGENEIIYFEHGSIDENYYAGNSVVHFHLHGVEVKKSYISMLENDFIKREYNSLFELCEDNWREDYILYIEKGKVNIFHKQGMRLESQYMRKLLFKNEKSSLENYNWKKYENSQMRILNVNNLRQYFSNKIVKKCVFCDYKSSFKKEQIIYENEKYYVCIPKGQIVEGFLILAPKDHEEFNCLAEAGTMFIDDILKSIVWIKEFYRIMYKCDDFIIYEQGRGCGNAYIDVVGGFFHHMHLCFMPKTFDFGCLLGENDDFVLKELSSIYDIQTLSEPYFLCCNVTTDEYKWKLLTTRTEENYILLRTFRFKEIFKKLSKIENAAQWRNSTMDDEYIGRVVSKFNLFMDILRDREK